MLTFLTLFQLTLPYRRTETPHRWSKVVPVHSAGHEPSAHSSSARGLGCGPLIQQPQPRGTLNALCSADKHNKNISCRLGTNNN